MFGVQARSDLATGTVLLKKFWGHCKVRQPETISCTKIFFKVAAIKIRISKILKLTKISMGKGQSDLWENELI